MNKSKRINLNIFIFLTLGLVTVFVTSVGAAIIISSNDVSVSSDSTSKTNLHDAVEELYGIASSTRCPYGKICMECDAGSYADQNNMVCTTCSPGMYSNGGTNSCLNCPSNYTSDAEAKGENECYIETTAGKFIEIANTSVQMDCPEGSYCPSEKIYYGAVGIIYSCPTGYTSDVGAESEIDCYVQTTAGKYIESNGAIETDCPSGSYCPSVKVYFGSTGKIYTCPTGYTSEIGSTSESDCYLVTTAGKYIATANSSTQTNCTAGSYCPSTKVYYGNTGGKESCPDGYTSSASAKAQNECYIQTTSGKYIDEEYSSAQIDCPVGSYCPSTKVYYGNTGSKATCPTGYTSAAKATAQNKCYVLTTAGKYIATANSSVQTTCPKGSYCPSSIVYYGSTGSITACPSGQTSPAGSTNSTSCKATSYTYTKTGGSFIGTYTCDTTTGVATLTSCRLSSQPYGCTSTYACKAYTANPTAASEICNPNASSTYGVYGGNMNETETCS